MITWLEIQTLSPWPTKERGAGVPWERFQWKWQVDYWRRKWPIMTGGRGGVVLQQKGSVAKQRLSGGGGFSYKAGEDLI